jgi:hypothetical protein
MGYRQRDDTLCAPQRESPGLAWSKRARNSAACLRSQALRIEWLFALSGGFSQECFQLWARLRVCEDPLPGRVAVLRRVTSSSPLLYEQDKIENRGFFSEEAKRSAIRAAISDADMRAPIERLKSVEALLANESRSNARMKADMVFIRVCHRESARSYRTRVPNRKQPLPYRMWSNGRLSKRSAKADSKIIEMQRSLFICAAVVFFSRSPLPPEPTFTRLATA